MTAVNPDASQLAVVEAALVLLGRLPPAASAGRQGLLFSGSRASCPR
jgi:hypothetical protein